MSPTSEKAMEYGSQMKNSNSQRLYLKSSTVEYLKGTKVSSVPRWGSDGRNQINDYFYLKGYSSTKLKTYTTHEAIYTNAYTAQLTQTY